MSNFYGATGLIGGGTGDLDNIDGTNLNTGDGAVVVTSTAAYHYYLNASSGAGESSPDIVSPDANAGNKRWILVKVISPTVTGIHSGTGTFAGAAGVTITIGSTLAGTSYRVVVTPLGVNAADLASIGPVGVGNKTTSSFDVFNLGSEAGTTFDWILINNS